MYHIHIEEHDKFIAKRVVKDNIQRFCLIGHTNDAKQLLTLNNPFHYATKVR